MINTDTVVLQVMTENKQRNIINHHNNRSMLSRQQVYTQPTKAYEQQYQQQLYEQAPQEGLSYQHQYQQPQVTLTHQKQYQQLQPMQNQQPYVQPAPTYQQSQTPKFCNFSVL